MIMYLESNYVSCLGYRAPKAWVESHHKRKEIPDSIGIQVCYSRAILSQLLCLGHRGRTLFVMFSQMNNL